MSNDQRSSDTKLEANSINDMAIKAAMPFDNGASATEERASIKTDVTAINSPINPGIRRISSAFWVFLGLSLLLSIEFSMVLFGGSGFMSCDLRLTLSTAQTLTAIAAYWPVEVNKK